MKVGIASTAQSEATSCKSRKHIRETTKKVGESLLRKSSNTDNVNAEVIKVHSVQETVYPFHLQFIHVHLYEGDSG